VAKPPAHLVADHRVAHGLAHHKTRPGCLGRSWRVRGQCVYDEAALTGPDSASQHDAEVLTTPQTSGSRQHGTPRRRPNQADSVSRPLRRRAPKMARPARVRMRRRNPWVRARRRLFGWKVRLPLLTAQNLLVSTSVARRQACRVRTRQSVVSPTNVWSRHIQRRQPGHTERTHCKWETFREYAPASGAPKPPPRPRTATTRSGLRGLPPDIDWQRPVHRGMLAFAAALWPGPPVVSVPLPGPPRTCSAPL
jgi:hypothetical protein